MLPAHEYAGLHRHLPLHSEKESILKRASISCAAPETDIEQLLIRGLSDGLKTNRELIDTLLAGMSALNAQVAFVHTSISDIQQSQLSIVIPEKPIEHDNLTIHVLIVLLNPASTAAADHLEHLANIAKAIGTPQRMASLITAKDSEAVQKALTEPIEE